MYGQIGSVLVYSFASTVESDDNEQALEDCGVVDSCDTLY